MALASPVSPGGPATKVGDRQPVADDVLQMANEASRRVRARAAQVRLRFIQRPKADDEKPPLARMLKGGQGGGAKLKVLLSLLWFGAGEGHDVTFPAHSYARLLGFDDPYGNGARRVRDSIDWLESKRLVGVERRPGREPVVTLLREDGSGAPYEVPGAAAKDPATKKALPVNHYLQLPAGFWTKGWAAHLEAPAVAMLLVLLAKAQSKPAHGIWISPSQLDDWYGFSDDTRRRGVSALEETGLVCVARAPVDPNYSRRRVRNIYSIEPALLGEPIDVGAHARWSGIAELLGQPVGEAWANDVNERLRVARDVSVLGARWTRMAG